MDIQTTEYEFEYQMVRAIKTLLNGLFPANAEELENLLWNNSKEFGRIVLERMEEWQGMEEWLREVHK